MEWIKATIYTTAEGVEPVSGRRYTTGRTGIEIEDEADFKEFLENNKQSWDYVDDELLKSKEKETCVIVYVTNDADGLEQLENIKREIKALKGIDTLSEYGRLDISISYLNEEDWANNWKKYYHPFNIGDKILIKPEWETIVDTGHLIVYVNNPGMSFGTGSHATTRLCIEALEKLVESGDRVLDLGCGSGILSIISLLLGAKSAYAVDIDPNAVGIAYENAERNNIKNDVYTVRAGNIITDKALQDDIAKNEYDIVVANIVADVIIALAPIAKRFMKSGGYFLTSGIITDRLDDVKGALEQSGFKIEETRISGDWASLISR